MDRRYLDVPLLRSVCRWADGVSGRVRTMPVQVRCEQAVYGNFDGGYAIQAQTPGWNREELLAFERMCQGLGERPPHVSAEGTLLVRRIPHGSWLITRVCELGRDDRGRSGALGFHAFLLSDRDYRRIGAAPFPLVPFLKKSQRSAPASLTSLALAVAPFVEQPTPLPEHKALVDALVRGTPIAVESAAPAHDLACRLWSVLPRSVRAQRSLATWLFGNPSQYDFSATPERLAFAGRPFADPNAQLRN